ncbi:MAG: hypothetical protein ACOYM8_17665 [Caulobacterales bacterium]
MNGARHKARFARWQARVGPETRALAELVAVRFVSRLEREGFARVDVHLRDPDSPTRPNEIQMERIVGTELDVAYVMFASYGLPRFQVGCARRKRDSPNEFVRAAKLVANANEYLHFWGKPWWRPVWSWSEEDAARAVGEVEEKIGQILRFLDSGEIGPNIHAQEISKRSNTV